MAGIAGRSGRKLKYYEDVDKDNRCWSQMILNRYLRSVYKMSDDELVSNPRAIEHCLQLELKAQDIEAKRQVAAIETAPIMELLARARNNNDIIDVTPSDALKDKIVKELNNRAINDKDGDS